MTSLHQGGVSVGWVSQCLCCFREQKPLMPLGWGGAEGEGEDFRMIECLP